MYDEISNIYDEIFPGPKGFVDLANSLVGGETSTQASDVAIDRKHIKILDLGCGPGTQVHQLRNLGFDARGVDPSKEMILKAQALGEPYFYHLSLQEISNHQWKYPFDLMYCIGNTFSYVPKLAEQKVAIEISKCLKSGGMLLLQTVNWDCINITQKNPYQFPDKKLSDGSVFGRKYRTSETPDQVVFETSLDLAKTVELSSTQNDIENPLFVPSVKIWQDLLTPRTYDDMVELWTGVGLKFLGVWGSFQSTEWDATSGGSVYLFAK